MKKVIIASIISFIAGITLTVGASILYNAKDIEFTSSKDNFTENNVGDALDKLYDLYNDKSYDFVAGMIDNYLTGTTYRTLNNTNLAGLNSKYVTRSSSGVLTFLESGTIKICSTAKGHAKDASTFLRVYHNSTVLYESRNANEALDCREVNVNINDTINIQTASTNSWVLGGYFIYFVK